jgi:hypothetical protein
MRGMASSVHSASSHWSWPTYAAYSARTLGDDSFAGWRRSVRKARTASRQIVQAGVRVRFAQVLRLPSGEPDGGLSRLPLRGVERPGERVRLLVSPGRLGIARQPLDETPSLIRACVWHSGRVGESVGQQVRYGKAGVPRLFALWRIDEILGPGGESVLHDIVGELEDSGPSDLQRPFPQCGAETFKEVADVGRGRFG